MGTQSNILAYDIERNADLFFRDVQDGANSLLVGKINSIPNNLLIVGGNCSVLGFNRMGAEAFWTVSGDNVTALELCDVDGDGIAELLVGSDDFEIRAFRHEEVVAEISETDKIMFLKRLEGNMFAYGLANGTVGVYKGVKQRLWRIKTKTPLTALEVFDIDLDGALEVVSGFKNGTFHIRNESSGELKFKGDVNSGIVAILKHDYRLTGQEELVVCSESGEVRGFLPVIANASAPIESKSLAELEDQKILNDLQKKKLSLLNELRLLEEGVRSVKSGVVSSNGLPQGTALSLELFADLTNKCISLCASLNTELVIVSLVATDSEGAVFSGAEVQVVSPSNPSRTATLRLRPTKSMSSSCLLTVQALISTRGSYSQMHVLEGEVRMPRFAVYAELGPEMMQSTRPPKSSLVFVLNETVSALTSWLQISFLLTTSLKPSGNGSLRVGFLSACGSSSEARNGGDELLFLEAVPSGNSVKLTINADSMDICAELVQDLARHFKINNLGSTANFPKEFKNFESVVGAVVETTASRVRLAADMADDSQRIKALVVRAEDSRLMSDMENMRRAYTDLFSMNNQLIGGYNARAGNHEALLMSLKDVNVMIQKAANLRVGKEKNAVITECREAVKANKMALLINIIKFGCSKN